jgi:hypothetical protein
VAPSLFKSNFIRAKLSAFIGIGAVKPTHSCIFLCFNRFFFVRVVIPIPFSPFCYQTNLI